MMKVSHFTMLCHSGRRLETTIKIVMEACSSTLRMKGGIICMVKVYRFLPLKSHTFLANTTNMKPANLEDDLLELGCSLEMTLHAHKARWMTFSRIWNNIHLIALKQIQMILKWVQGKYDHLKFLTENRKNHWDTPTTWKLEVWFFLRITYYQ